MKLLIALMFSFFMLNQTIEIIQEFEIEGNLLTVDEFGNTYTGSKDVLYKFGKTGKKLNSYSNKLLGNVSFLDVSNPLRFLVYYQDIGRVVFLDNTLSIHNEVVLEHYGFEQTTLACSSTNAAFWVYDAMEFRLLKLDDQIKVVQNSGNLIQLFGVQINPNYLIEVNSKVYLNDPESGIYVFDIYGNYIKKIPIPGLLKFQIIDEKIVYQKNNELINFNIKSLQEQKLDLEKYNPNTIRVYNNQLIIQQNAKVLALKIVE